MIEIERKYLVHNLDWLPQAKSSFEIEQAYIFVDYTKEYRVTIRGNKAYTTLKSRHKLIRKEFEKEITIEEANYLISSFSDLEPIIKTRYEIPILDGLKWEIDVFKGENEGLILAEIELPNPDYKITLPDWIGEEVTNDSYYYNSNIYQLPYQYKLKQDEADKTYDNWRDSIL